MITVIVPTLNAEAGLAATLTSLVTATVEGLVREVIVVDGGSTDRTLKIAEQSGATILRVEPGRGRQLAAGAEAARFPWLLFLHADTVLDTGWEREAGQFIDRVDLGKHPEAAAAFRFALDDLGMMPRVFEAGVGLRCALLKLPYGDQGLLMPARLYRSVGGFRPIPLMEDVDLARRLGRRRRVLLRAQAVTSAVRYRNEGYALRAMRNLTCLSLFYLRVPTSMIAKIYK